eukprot:1195806-Prorocentrum_minimum.AAC.8
MQPKYFGCGCPRHTTSRRGTTLRERLQQLVGNGPILMCLTSAPLWKRMSLCNLRNWRVGVVGISGKGFRSVKACFEVA